MKGGDIMFYNFILSMWVRGSLSAEGVQNYVPKFINQTECDLILATPQLTTEQLAILATI